MELFIKGIPKTDLHIKGKLEPETSHISRSNRVKVRYKTIEEIRAAYNFKNASFPKRILPRNKSGAK